MTQNLIRAGLIFGVVTVIAVGVGLSIQNNGVPASSATPPATTSARPSSTYVPPTTQPPVITQAPVPVSTEPHREITSREWAQIAKSPDSHIGQRVIVYGHVTQFDAITGASGFRANVDGVRQKQTYEYDTNTVLSGTQTLLADVVQDDTFRAEVTVVGSFSYATTMGGQLTVPRLSIDSIKVL